MLLVHSFLEGPSFISRLIVFFRGIISSAPSKSRSCCFLNSATFPFEASAIFFGFSASSSELPASLPLPAWDGGRRNDGPLFQIQDQFDEFEQHAIDSFRQTSRILEMILPGSCWLCRFRYGRAAAQRPRLCPTVVSSWLICSFTSLDGVLDRLESFLVNRPHECRPPSRLPGDDETGCT